MQNFASTYSNPLDQFLYGIFFPSILLVILIYLLIQRIFPEHRGLAVLLGVSFYIFIIVYPPNAATSLYAAFAPIGAFWYLVVILIGIIYLFFNRILPSDRARGGGGGGGARGMATAYRKAMGKENRRTNLLRPIYFYPNFSLTFRRKSSAVSMACLASYSEMAPTFS